MLPDLDIAPVGFHDVLIENLAASPTWRSRHISPGDVTLLRRRWPKAVFTTMRRRSKEVERLRRFARHHPEWALRHNKPGFCSGTDHLCFGRPYDQCSSEVGTIVAVPGGVVRCLEGLCE